MIYSCTVLRVEEETIQIDINGERLCCFCGSSTLYKRGDAATVDLELFGDIECEATDEAIGIYQVGDGYSYSIVGVLDVENGLLHSWIDFPLCVEDLLYDGYLDGHVVKICVLRIDISFV